MGIGKKNTPRAFVNACEEFVYTENLVSEADIPTTTKPLQKPSSTELLSADPFPLIKKAFDMAVQDDGWAFLGAMGTRLRQLDPGFDSRSYGYKQLSLLVRAYSQAIEVREVKSRRGPSVVYIRLRE